MDNFILQEISAFGDYAPSVPFADGIDKEALIDGDNDPMFVTLPIGRVNARSHNGRIYNQKAVEAIVKAINEQRNGGNKGHLRSEDRSTRFDLPVLQWVGAILDDNGKAYGKAYIPRYASSVREYIKNVKAVRGRIATSIYGSADMNGDVVENLEIESIDLVDPTRAGVPDAVAIPILTSEMTTTGENTMSDNNHDILISELRTDRNNALQEVAELRVKLNSLEAKLAIIPQLEELLGTKDIVEHVTEMKEQADGGKLASATVAELKAELNTKNIQEAIQELRKERDEAQRKNMAHEAHRLITEKVHYANARSLIADMVGMDWDNPEAKALPFADNEALEKAIDAVISKESVQEMVKALILKETGGRAYVGKDLPKQMADTDENRQAARNSWGF